MNENIRSPRLRIHLLGQFQISIDIRPIPDEAWKRRKAASLVKLVALSPGHRLHRERLVELLWPELDFRAADRNLHHTLHVTRQIFHPYGSVLRLEQNHVFFEPAERPWVDVDDFETVATRARHTRLPEDYRAALAAYTGDLLPDDLYEEWALEPRASLRALALSLALELAHVLLERSDSAGATGALQRALQLDSACEEAHVELMRIYSHAGKRHQALRQYEQMRTALQAELDVEPSAASQTLFELIRAGTPAPAAGSTRSPSSATTQTRHNLPAPLTSFIGREHEVREIQHAFSATRVITLTGIGGSGKTRLALEAAEPMLDRFQDGIWLVELGSIADPALVPEAIASVFGISAEPDQSIQATLVDRIHERRMLVLLDNCEHVIEAGAEVATTLLMRCPHLRILATSREALLIAGETTLRVPPLTIPPSRPVSSPDALLAFDAVRLLVERARYRDPDFQLNAENASAAVSICRQLEGIPLAIELAAARSSVLSLQQIASHLRHSIGLLAGRVRTTSPRHVSLHAALNWSYDLLSRPEQILFRRLAIFSRGWTLEAARTIASDEEISADDILDLLSNLVDKSLIVTERAEDEQFRYRLLEPVRQYARDQLAGSGELDDIQARHAGFLISMLETARFGLTGPDQPMWLHRLDAERDNLRGALMWSEEADPGLGFHLASLVWFPWYMQGHLHEAREWLDRMFALNPRSPLPIRILALRGLGATAQAAGEYDRATGALEEALSICRHLGDDEQAGRVLNQLAIAVKNSGNFARATALHEESLALRRMRRDDGGVAESLVNLGSLCTAQGEWSRAEAFFNEALALERQFGDDRMIAIGLNNLGELWLRQGEFARAAPFFTEALSLGRDLGEMEVVYSCLDGLAREAQSRGRWKRALRLYGAADSIRRESGFSLHGDKRDLYDRALSELRSAVGDEGSTEAWNEGADMGIQDAIAYALARKDPVPSLPRHSPDTPRNQHVSPLSARESEVADLVSQGLTNREIACALTIAERTVDTHMSKILRKLGLSSRVQLARWTVDH